MPQRVQEIYPSAPQPEATFKSKFDNSIAKLFVQPNQPQNIQAVNPNRRKPAVKKRKKKDSKIIFVMCALLIFSATILGTTFSIVNNVSHTVYEDNETYNAVTVEMKENNDLTNKNFLIDPVENIRYICDDWYFDMLVDASYGFVELHDVNSDEIRYFSRQNITDEGEEIYTTEDGQRYRIYPFAENLFLSDISASDYHNYVILKSESTGDSFFIDKQYIQPFEKAEAATAPISTVANDTKKLSNEEEQINE